DNSEVAANVFASMLGVASSSPQFPPQPASSPLPPQGGQYTPPQIPQGAQPPMAAGGMNSGNYGQKPTTPPGVAAQPPSPVPSAYGAPGGYPSGMHQGNTPNPYATGASQNTGPFNNRPGTNQYGSASYPGNVPGVSSPLPGAAAGMTAGAAADAQ